MSRFRCHSPLSLLALLLAGGCQTTPALPPPSIAPAELVRVNTAVNQQGRPCPDDLCLSDWPDATDLDRLTAWDCKAYAVAKADRLIRWGYPPDRLEYVLVAGPSLRVTHAALLVDGHWVLDIGLRCQVCTLEAFIGEGTLQGRLPVADLPYARRALRW
ncbi:MAG: transglutaminase-like cysteine peptidase [Candidatus Competibacteraceae bacterium]|nr:MAG: transglutaminase-like cysteine peptidase [Candidatus Competibacteraceae bacterium]